MVATWRVDDAQLGVFDVCPPQEHVERGWDIIQAFLGKVKRELQTNEVPPWVGELSII